MKQAHVATRRSQDRYRNRRTDVPNDAIQLEDGTYLLLETGHNIIREDGVGVSYQSNAPIRP